MGPESYSQVQILTLKNSVTSLRATDRVYIWGTLLLSHVQPSGRDTYGIATEDEGLSKDIPTAVAGLTPFVTAP